MGRIDLVENAQEGEPLGGELRRDAEPQPRLGAVAEPDGAFDGAALGRPKGRDLVVQGVRDRRRDLERGRRAATEIGPEDCSVQRVALSG